MKKVLAMLSLVGFLNQGQVFAEGRDIRTATISCVGTASTELTYASGEIQFPQDYGTYLKKIKGSIGLVLPFEASKSQFTVTGYYFANRFGEPSHWIMFLKGTTGEIRQFVLSKSDSDNMAFGSVELDNGDTFAARCKIIMQFPPNPNRPHRCYPKIGCY